MSDSPSSWHFEATNTLVNEVIGALRPGYQPVIQPSSVLPEALILVHEYGHRTLCTGTTVGNYHICLAHAMKHSKDPLIRGRAEAHLLSTIADCWVTHEGLATSLQFHHCMIFPELDGFAEVFVSQLRNDYIAAFLRFDLSNAFVSYMTALLMAPCAIQNDSGIFFSFTPNPRDIPEVGRMACLAIADAAMSIPLKVVLNSCHSLPSLEILAAIRRSPPDTRLNQITDYLRRNPRDFEEFIRKVAYYRLIEYKQFGKSGSTPRVAAELCSLVGLDHEASAGFPKDVWRKMGVELDFSVQEVSDRDASMKSNGLVVLSKPIGPGFLDMKEQASLDATIADHGEKCGNAPPLIVCEVGPGQDSDGNLLDVAVVSLYSFVADSAYARLKHFAHFVIHPPVVPTLPSLFRHCKWIWLTDMNRLGACGIATKELTGGDVYLPTNNLDSLGDMNLYSVGHRLPEGEQPPPDGVSKVPEYLPEGVHLAVIELPPNDWKEVRTWHVSFWLPLGPLNGRNRGNGEHSAIAHAMYWGTIYESASVSAGVHVRVRS